jgi:cysteine-rich repeat protein
MGGTDQCDPDADPPACVADPCANLPNLCSTVGTTCSDDGITLVTCALNDDGCKVQTTTNCTNAGDNNYCKSTGTSACAFDKCRDGNGQPKPNQCVEDEAMCADDTLVTCVADGQGCKIAHQTPCNEGDTNFCSEDGTPMCDFDYCIEEQNCLSAGKTCNGTKLVDCELNIHNCLVKTITDCKTEANQNFTCDEESGSCLACTDDVGCERANSKAEGDSVCDNNTLSTCTDTDGDGCLNKVTTACGSNFTCDADNDKCGFSGAEQCDAPITAVLALDATSATFDTGAGTPASHYGNWSACPMLQNNTFTAAAPDLLFAIDVPPKTVVDISLVGVTGFTGNNTTGAWVELLTSCGGSGTTQAEASCKSIARAPSYANETDNPVRIYVVVDADGTAATTGTFQIKVDSHEFACGDGVRDGSEACDDGNVRSGDGCTTSCVAETGFLCTKANPSVCTRRPQNGDNTCGNVDCGTPPSGTTRCCTPDAKCGVTWDLVFGASCLEVGQQGASDSECAAANSAFTFISPNIPGCCRTEDHMCGLLNGNGVGCMKRSEVWTAMQDGIGRFLYSASAFADKSCTP